MAFLKNTAGQKLRVFAYDRTTGVPVTGDAANITVKVSKDWAAAAAITDVNPTETEDGYYLFDLTQEESNAEVLDVFPESATADVQVIGVPGTIFTDNGNITRIAGSGDAATQLAAQIENTAGMTLSGTPTATSFVTDMVVTIDDQFKGRIVVFDKDTTTAALRNQVAVITGCTAASNTLTVTGLTSAPVSGDTARLG